MRLGAIDVGTNSIHLIVVDLDPRFGTSRTVRKRREMVRLGGGDAFASRTLGKKAIARAVVAIARFAAEARATGAEDVRAVATSAVREAANRAEFVAEVRAAVGIDVEVLDGPEEARLIHLGVARGSQLDERIGCIIDIGGGSTEFIVGDAERPYFIHSAPLGSLRLYETYLRDARDSVAAAKKMRAHIEHVLAPVVARLADYRYDVVIGTSGTIMGLAALDAARGGAMRQAHGYVLELAALRELQRTMIRLTPAERRKLPGMNPRRSDIIVAGAAVLIEALSLLGRDRIVVSERALREGIVVDYLTKNAAIMRRIDDERARRIDAVHDLARRFHAGGAHESHVAALALDLFDRLSDVHRLEPAERDVLFAAAMLHDVGRTINPSAHHKHGAYIVRSSGIPHWSPDDVELIASIVRYHRRSLPKPTHPEWMVASEAMRMKMLSLAAILRIADGLDARRQGTVRSLAVEVRPSEVRIEALAPEPIDAEIAGARFKSDAFVRAFGIPARIEAVRTEDETAAENDEGSRDDWAIA